MMILTYMCIATFHLSVALHQIKMHKQDAFRRECKSGAFGNVSTISKQKHNYMKHDTLLSLSSPNKAKINIVRTVK